MKNKLFILTWIFLLMAFSVSAQISSGGAFEITNSVIASGGGTSTGADFEIVGANGQSVTEISHTSPFRISSGFFTGAPLAPTAAEVTVGGRVLTYKGRGIARVYISITDGNGSIRATTTNQFGYYRFTNLGVGQTYILSAASKRFQFAQPTQVLFVSEDFTDLNFTALP